MKIDTQIQSQYKIQNKLKNILKTASMKEWRNISKTSKIKTK